MLITLIDFGDYISETAYQPRKYYCQHGIMFLLTLCIKKKTFTFFDMQLRLDILSFIYIYEISKDRLICIFLASLHEMAFSGFSNIWHALPASTKPLCLSLHMALLRLLCLALERCHCVSVSTSQMATHKHINTRHS